MMSGLANGLRARRWKMAPDIPKAAPTSTAVSARGKRRVRTMKALSSVPRPTSVASTSRIGMGKSPTDRDHANTPKHSAAATSEIHTARVCTRADHPRRGHRTTTRRSL